MESFASIVLLAVAGSAIAGLSATTNPGKTYSSIESSNLVFDFPAIVNLNSTVAGCLANLTYGCSSGIFSELDQAYGLSYSQITVGNRSESSGLLSLCKNSQTVCTPIAINKTYSVACLYFCSG